MATHAEGLERARLSLEGLSVGDALGAFLELHRWTYDVSTMIEKRQIPQVEWRFTDDTNMALSIYAILRRHQKIEQDELAGHFAQYYDRGRGYGQGAKRLLMQLQEGGDWRELASTMFEGGSFGNGAAMRIAPLGAYFADDMPALIENAKLSAEITHAHPEGIAGAIAVAVAAAVAWHIRQNEKPSRKDFIKQILPHIPESEVKSRVIQARDIQSTEIEHVVGMIGNGSQISAQDTVPYVLFCVGEWLDNYEEAIWQTMSGGGDVDTTCAMVGGIVALYTGYEGIPQKWLEQREKFPDWAFED